MLKSQEFMDRLAHVGEGVLVFEQALLLKPEAISLGDGTRSDDVTRILFFTSDTRADPNFPSCHFHSKKRAACRIR